MQHVAMIINRSPLNPSKICAPTNIWLGLTKVILYRLAFDSLAQDNIAFPAIGLFSFTLSVYVCPASDTFRFSWIINICINSPH